MILYYLLRSIGLIVLGLLIYAQTFRFDFVFDDYIFIVNNPFVKNLSNFHLMWHSFPLTRLVGMYSFALNYYLGQLHPQGYHVFNFMVHMVAVGLVWALADLLFKITKAAGDKATKELPLIIAALFLVHPCQTQAVTYITQRFESMATVFYLATIYTYLQARVTQEKLAKIIFFILAGLFTLLGIMTKEVVITVPVMILAVEWILFPKKDNKKFYIALGFAGVFLYILISKLLHAGIESVLQAMPSESHDGDILTPVTYVLTEFRVFLTFLRLLVLPIHQNLEYDYPASINLLNPPLTLLGLAMIIGFVLLIIKLRRRYPLFAFGLAWVLITFSINLAPRSNVIFEHKLYLISFGFLLSTVCFFTTIFQDRRTLFKILGCIVLILGVVSYQRNKVWANEVSLWEDSIKYSPNKARVNASLGRVYGSQGQYDKSIFYLSRAISLKSDNISYENRGVIYAEEGQLTQAIDDLNKSISMDPYYFVTYVKRSWVYQIQHNYQAALDDINHAIALDPNFADAHIEKGMLEMAIGNPQEALVSFQNALKIEPFDYEVILNRGVVYYSLKQYDLALTDFNKALALEPSSTQAAQYKAYCLLKRGRN